MMNEEHHNGTTDSRLGRIEGTLTAMQTMLAAHFIRQEADMKALNERLRSLERWKNYTMGVAAAAGGAVGLIWKKFGG